MCEKEFKNIYLIFIEANNCNLLNSVIGLFKKIVNEI